MSTMTITESVRALALEALPPVSVAKELQESLCAILERYRSWKDPLSKKLFAWGVEVISLDLKGDNFSPQAQERALILADELARKILINPFDNSSLTEPMLDRERWVWEKSMLDDVRTLTPNSPFTNKPFDVTPHHFAWDIIDWTALFQMNGASRGKVEKLESKRAAPNTEVVSAQAVSVEERATRVIEYQAKAFIVTLNQLTDQTQKLNATIDECAKTMEAFEAAQAKLAKQEAERALATATAHVESVTATIAANDKVRSAEVQVLNNNIQDLSTRYTQRTEESNARQRRVEALENRVAAQDRTIANLSGEVNHLRHKGRGSDCIIC